MASSPEKEQVEASSGGSMIWGGERVCVCERERELEKSGDWI